MCLRLTALLCLFQPKKNNNFFVFTHRSPSVSIRILTHNLYAHALVGYHLMICIHTHSSFVTIRFASTRFLTTRLVSTRTRRLLSHVCIHTICIHTICIHTICIRTHSSFVITRFVSMRTRRLLPHDL